MSVSNDNDLLRFNAYMDGDLSDAEAAQLADDLASDPVLQAEFDAFVETVALLGKLGDDPLPEVDLRSGVERKIRKRSRGRFFSPRSEQRQRLQTQGFLLIAVLFLIGVVVMISPSTLGPIEEVEGSGDAAPEPPSAPAPGGDTAAVDEPPARAPAFEGQALGRVSDLPIADIRHRGFTYTVTMEQEDAGLARRLRDQFGDAVIEVDGGFDIEVPREDIARAVQQVSDLGRVIRESADLDGARRTSTFRIRLPR